MKAKLILKNQSLDHDCELVFAIRLLLRNKEEIVVNKGDEITIIINRPEKRITITESELREVLIRKARSHDEIIENLFGEGAK